MLPYNVDLKELSRQLRKNMTDAERRLWARIRMKQLKGCQFYRQKPIGEYIVDFFCPKAEGSRPVSVRKTGPFTDWHTRGGRGLG